MVDVVLEYFGVCLQADDNKPKKVIEIRLHNDEMKTTTILTKKKINKIN